VRARMRERIKWRAHAHISTLQVFANQMNWQRAFL